MITERFSRPFSIHRVRRMRGDPFHVGKLIVDSSTWPDWQPEIVSIEAPKSLGPGDVARGEANMLGFEVHGHTTATEVGPGVFEEDVVVGVRMRIRYEWRADNDGSEVTQRLTAQMPSGAAGRVLSLFLRWRLRKLQRDALDQLARHSERPSG